MRVAVVVFLAFVFVAPARAAQFGGPDPQQVDATAVAYAPDGTLLVGDEDRRIARLDAHGTVVESIALSAAPRAIAAGPSGVVVAIANGRLLAAVRPGAAVALGRAARGLAVAANGTVLVGDPGREAIRRFSADGLQELLPLQLPRAATDLAVLTDGLLAVTLDSDFDAPGLILILDDGGNEVRRITLPRSSSVIAAAPGGALVTEDGFGRLTRITADGHRTRITEYLPPSDLTVAPDGGLVVVEIETAQYGGQVIQLVGVDASGQSRPVRPQSTPPAPGALENPYAVGVAPGGGPVAALDLNGGLPRFIQASGVALPRLPFGFYLDQVAPLRGGGYLVSEDDVKFGRSIALLDARGRLRRRLGSVEEQPELCAAGDGGFVTTSVPSTKPQRTLVQRYGPTGRRKALFAVTGIPQLVALPHGEVATIRTSRITIHRPNGKVRRTRRLPGLNPIDAATDGHRTLLILQEKTVRRYSLTTGRRLADALSDDDLRDPRALAVSGSRIYVADTGNDRISILRTPTPAPPSP